METIKKKKKMGRPKKRGPKKKRKSRAKPKPKIYAPPLQWDWKIVIVSNGKQVGYVDKYLTMSEAYEAFEKCRLKSRNVLFESKVKNSHILVERKDEYLLLERNRSGLKPNSLLRNEYGVLIEQISSNKNWIILDKTPCKQEETFWVYGLNPRTQRKDFRWIFDNIVKTNLDNPEDFKRIISFKNKIIIRSDDGFMDIIICKTPGEGARFYNMIQTVAQKEKIDKKLIFCGSYARLSEKRRMLEDEIMEITGWSRKKVGLKSTRS